MKRHKVERYRDVDLYIAEIEEVYDVSLTFEFTPIVRVGMSMALMTIRGFDKHDCERATGPLLYTVAEVPSNNTYKRQQAIIRALTDITSQCFDAYCTRTQLGVIVP